MPYPNHMLSDDPRWLSQLNTVALAVARRSTPSSTGTTTTPAPPPTCSAPSALWPRNTGRSRHEHRHRLPAALRPALPALAPRPHLDRRPSQGTATQAPRRRVEAPASIRHTRRERQTQELPAIAQYSWQTEWDVGRIEGKPRNEPRALTREERTAWLAQLEADPTAVRKGPPACAGAGRRSPRIVESPHVPSERPS